MSGVNYRAWFWAFFSVTVLWSLINIAAQYSTKILEVNYLVFTCSAFASSAFLLLAWSGSGPLTRETFRSVDTWAFGLILLFDYIFLLGIFSFVTATEGSILKRMSLLFGVLASWMFFSRRVGRGQYLGLALVMASIVMVASEVPADVRGPLYMLVLMSGLAEAARVLVAEIHRPHQHAAQSSDPKAKARVVGGVMFVISAIFLTITALLAVAQSFSPGVEIPVVPSLDDFSHAPSIFAGMAVGALLITPVRLIEFSSAQAIKAESFLALAAFSTLATLLWESILGPWLHIGFRSLADINLPAVILVTFGGLTIAYSKMRSKQVEVEDWQKHLVKVNQDIAAVDDSRDLVGKTLSHFDGDMKRVAKALHLPLSVIQAIATDQLRVLAFAPNTMKEVERLYRKNVAESDSLTGLMSRGVLVAELTRRIGMGKPFAVAYLDLDRFKPINDTYGHQAGDFAIQQTAKRLQKVLPLHTPVARLGGDEFAVILPVPCKPWLPKMVRVIGETMTYKKKAFKVGVSIGVAEFPAGGQGAEALLDAADRQMLLAKKAAGRKR